MLPAAHRLRRPEQYRAVLRGRSEGARWVTARSGSALMSVHVAQRPGDEGPVRVGFVVSKAVGNSVVRHRTVRRLRHLVAAELPEVPAGHDVVVRAHPRSAQATHQELAADLSRCLGSALRKVRAEVAV